MEHLYYSCLCKNEAIAIFFDRGEERTLIPVTVLLLFSNAITTLHGTVNRWKKQGKVFALQRNGQDYYPRYLFGDDFRPLDAAEQVIGILAADGRFGPDRLASWFESPTGLLDGGRPRERLATSPDEVILAARRTLDAELYAA